MKFNTRPTESYTIQNLIPPIIYQTEVKTHTISTEPATYFSNEYIKIITND